MKLSYVSEAEVLRKKRSEIQAARGLLSPSHETTVDIRPNYHMNGAPLVRLGVPYEAVCKLLDSIVVDIEKHLVALGVVIDA